MRLRRKKKNKWKIFLFLIGITLILVGSSTLTYRTIRNKVKIEKEQEKIEQFLKEEVVHIEKEKEESNENQQQENAEMNYVAVIEIPKIRLKKGLVDKESIDNDVNKNIYTIKESIFPKEDEYSQIILASHSGNSYISYFKRIHELTEGDLIYLYYNKQKYTYKVVKKYEIKKDGTATIGMYRESNINLITCIEKTDKQLVIAATLIFE